MLDMIPGLDGLRAIAFLLVFAFHADYLQFGWVGVSLFFVLSGFLITGILLDMKKTLLPKEFFVKFYGRRFLRIFPLYYFYLLLITGVTTWLVSIQFRPRNMQIVLDQIWYAVFYVFDFLSGTAVFRHSYFLDHFWSLSVEEQFYIFWPLLLLLVPERAMKKFFIIFILLGPVFRIMFFFVYRSGVFRFLATTAPLAVYPLPLSHIDAFALGAYISRHPISKAKAQFFLLLAIIPVVGFTTQYLATGEIGTISALGFPLLLPEAYQFVWGYSLLNYFFALAIHCVVKEGLFLRVLEWMPVRYLGKISYGLYVYHYPVIWFVSRIRDIGVDEPLAKVLTALISLPVTILIASASYNILEKPLLSLKDRFFDLKSSPAESA